MPINNRETHKGRDKLHEEIRTVTSRVNINRGIVVVAHPSVETTQQLIVYTATPADPHSIRLTHTHTDKAHAYQWPLQFFCTVIAQIFSKAADPTEVTFF